MAFDNGIMTRSFNGKKAGSEHYIVVDAPLRGTLNEQIAEVERRYNDAQKSLGLDSSSAVFRRLFLSDAINQAPAVRKSSLVRESKDSPVAVSIVQQPPLAGAKLALLAHHVDGPIKKKRVMNKHVMIERNGIKHFWSTCLCPGAHAATAPEDVHTREIFHDLIEALARQKANLADHCVRTWLFMKDVDVFYRGMVSSRRELFLEHDLSADTHYIASTGIEGACEHQFDLVLMDAYSILNLKPQQITYLNDFDHLCPTIDYSVTFERGTRIAFADRAHHYISGTASIDKEGNVMHVGDVGKQLDRTLENIGALLKSGGASLDDMMYMIVYLRDPADHALIDASLRERLPHVPYLIVLGPVCRPEWLIEIEGVAAANHHDESLPSF
jgi:enamine deaminase RidA (YjgF/YER057c/UK114 family)